MALQDYYNTGDDTQFSASDTGWKGQTFTTSIEYVLGSIKIKGWKTDTTTITVEIYATSGGLPTGSVLSSGTISSDLFGGTPGTWQEVSMSAYTLQASTQYAISIKTAAGSTGFNWRCDVSSPSYSGGTRVYSNDSGSTWFSVAGSDHVFEVWGDQEYNAIPTGDNRYNRYFVSFAGNKVYYGTDPAVLTAFSGAEDDIDCNELLTACEADGKVFVANGVNRKVFDLSNSKITTADIVGGGAIPHHDTVLTGGSSGAKMVCDLITTVTGACTVYGRRITTATFTSGETVTGTNDDDAAVSFVLNANEVAGPFWYDMQVYGADATNYGAIPNKAHVVRLYQGRVTWTADNDNPHQWYMARQSNPWDYIFGEDDTQTAIAGNNADASEVGDIVVDAYPYKDAYLVFGCASTLYYIVGNPAMGGAMLELDLTAGLLGPGAWCWDSNENLYLMSTRGLLKIPTGFGPPQKLFEESYPDFIKDLAFDRTLHRCRLAHDPQRSGITIHKTVVADGTNQNWFYSLLTGALFPEIYPEECAVFSTLDFRADDPSDDAILYGTYDGYARKFLDTAKSDDIGDTDEAIDSYFAIGPVPLSSDDRVDGLIKNIRATFGVNSDDVAVSVYTDRIAETVFTNAVAGSNAKFSRDLTSANGSMNRSKARGRYAIIVLRNSTVAETWEFESVNYDVTPIGRVR